MFEKIVRLIKHTLIYGLGNTGNRLVGFLLLPLYTRYLTPQDYGVLALVGLLDQVLFIVMGLGQGTGVFRRYFMYDGQEQREVVLTTALWLVIGLSFPVGLLGLALSKPLAVVLTGSADYTSWVMLGVGVMALKTLLRMPYAALRAREESWKYSAASFVQTTSSMLLAVFFLVALAMGGRGVLLSQLVAELLLAAYLLPAAIGGRRLRFSMTEARDLLGYSAYQIPTGLLSLFLHMSDRYFLKHYGSLEAVGLYSLGYRFGEILGFAMTAFALAWGPFMFENRKSDEAPALYARVSTYYVVGLGALWLAVSLLSREVITIMARPSFHEAYRVVPWIAGAFFFQGLAYVGNVGIAINRKVKYRPLILGVATAINLGLNWLLVPTHGMVGAAVAAAASFLVWLVLQVAVAQRLYRVPYEYARIARVLAVVVVLYAAGMAIPWGSLWAAVAGKSALILCLPLLLYLSGFLHPGEMTRARGMLRAGRRRRGMLAQAEGPVE